MGAVQNKSFKENIMQKIQTLQVLRAVAAIMVVFFHAHSYMLPHKLEEGASVFRGFNMGYAGVEIFFVISGFIMWHIHRMDIGVSSKFLSYAYKRIVRIYPLYLLVLFSLVGLYFVFPDTGPDNARNIHQIFLSATLIPLPFIPVMEVAWTLQYEMFFYVMFSLLIANKRKGYPLMIIWALGCMTNLFIDTQVFPFSFIFSAYNLLFMLGGGAAYILHQKNFNYGFIIPVVGGGLFLSVGLSEAYRIIEWYKPLRTVLYGLGAFLMLGMLFHEKNNLIKYPSGLLLLGDSTYSIYLTHGAVLMILAKFAKFDFLSFVPSTAMFFAITIISIIGGLAFYWIIERNIIRFFRTLWINKNERVKGIKL